VIEEARPEASKATAKSNGAASTANELPPSRASRGERVRKAGRGNALPG
jgi:hypothetical protein